MKLFKSIVSTGLSLTLALQMCSPATNALATELQGDQQGELALVGNDEGAVAYADDDSYQVTGDGDSVGDSTESADDGSQPNQDADPSGQGDQSQEDQTDNDNDSQQPEVDNSQAEDGAVTYADDSENVSAQAATYEINSLSGLQTALQSTEATVTSDASAVTAIDNATPNSLIVLSHANPNLYSNAQINFKSTGDFDLTGSCSYGGKELAYQGLGSENDPFSGSFINAPTFKLNRALFAGYKPQSSVSFTLRFTGDDQSGNLFADCIDGNSQEIDVTAVFAANGSSNPSQIAAPLLGDVKGTLTLTAKYQKATGTGSGDFTGNTSILVSDGDAGLIARTVSSNATLTLKSFTGFKPSSGTTTSTTDVSSSKGNAGLFVGSLGSLATFEACGLGETSGTGAFKAISPKGTISASSSGAAGGLVGATAENATVKVAGNEINLSNLTVKGQYAGGFIGKAVKLSLKDDNFAGKLTPAATVGDSGSYCAGGLFGYVSFNSDFTLTADSNKLSLPSSGFTVGSKYSSGGLFGQLVLEHNVSLSDRTDIKSVSAGNSSSSYGGVAGRLTSSVDENVLTILNTTVESKGGTSNAQHYGGVIGLLGNNDKQAALKIENVTSKCSSPCANRGFGGVAGCIDRTGVIDLGSFSLDTGSEAVDQPVGGYQSGSGGIAGEIWPGGVIQLSGVTDLTKAQFQSEDRVGQLVGYRMSGLVYALGSGSDSRWTLKRGAAIQLDDVASYGEVIRLQGDDASKGLSNGLISLGTDHKVKFSKILTPATDKSISISSLDDFALLAITWQTFGNISAIRGVQTDNKNASQSRKTWNPSGNIVFTNDVTIDLTGTGITGLSRDVDVVKYDNGGNTVEYTGTFEHDIVGNGATLTLSVGEPYGLRGDARIESTDTSEGNGCIYRHNRLGLLASVKGNATGLTLQGTMNFTAKSAINAGALAASLSNGAEASLSSLQSQVKVTCGSADKNPAYVGGIYGTIEQGAESLTFASANTVSLETALATHPQYMVYGGAIGKIDGQSSAAIAVNTNGLTIKGAITASQMTDDKGATTTGDSIPAGGFIGVVYEGTKKSVFLNGLSFDELSLVYPGAESAGGLLGYSWADTDVTFGDGGLKTTNSSFGTQSNGTGTGSSSQYINRAGGLAYRASGKWQVNNGGIDLSGYTISNVGGTGSELGLLVCRGGASKESIAGTQAYTRGLYAETTAEWNDACTLNENICECRPDNFDEWICSTTDKTSDTGTEENVLASGLNGVVSLHTTAATGQEAILAMDGSSINTYQNRTTYGSTKNTNPNTRYYYNLDVAKSNINADGDHNRDGEINTAQELLIWSVIKYADPTIASYFYTSNGTDCASSELPTTITGKLKMQGYSYYPVDISNTNITLENASITFYNKEIEQSETTYSNKSTAAATQHMAMHAGLFRDYSVVSDQSQVSNTLAISQVAFAGSVGVMSAKSGSSYTLASSGALICGDAWGTATANGAKNLCKIAIDGCTLNGIGVNGFNETGYYPLLINGMGSRDGGSATLGYIDLSVNNVRLAKNAYTGGSTVATSLLGNLGSTQNTQITVSFSKIALPSKPDEKIFSKATLLNSFAYKSGADGYGSATYNFTNAEGTAGFVTYGQEIDRQGTEYSGLQLWYFDEDTYGTVAGLVKDGDSTASADNPAFGDYLPYVFTRHNADGNHEIKVNQRLEDLVTGCGTYTDPYEISTQSKLVTLASYIENPSSANDGWKITIAKNQSQACQRRAANGSDTSNEVTYEYSKSDDAWKTNDGDSGTLANEVMHRYIQSCYIDVNVKNEDGNAGELELNTAKFTGLGSKDNPFRGVITSTNGTKLKITNDEGHTFNGLITYSYGCVVKNLSITYAGHADTVKYGSKDSTHNAPGSFFGGVFGEILGGDNIIDGVSIEADGFSVAADGDKPYLVPIGGYVGAIAGGGVIFRGQMGASRYQGSASDYYNNPVVGRVLDGYAFIEGDGCKIGDNTCGSKVCNYKINKLDTAKTGDNASIETNTQLHNPRVNTDDTTANKTTVKDAQGLLVLSAIINSGAAAGPVNSGAYSDWMGWTGYRVGTNAYDGLADSACEEAGYKQGNGNYGKVRNASYDGIGDPSSATDFAVSVKDDTLTPGSTDGTAPESIINWDTVNAPYLVAHYAKNKATMFICGAGLSSMDLWLGSDSSAETFDMSDYGNGYRGLSGSYHSNASTGDTANKIASSHGNSVTYSRDRLLPWVAHVAGNNKTLKVSLDVQEYSNDDFGVLGVGALFGTVILTQFRIEKTSTTYNGVYFQDLRIGDSTIRHEVSSQVTENSKKYMGVGAIAGVAASENTMNERQVKLANVTVSSTTVQGPASAGGYFGDSGIYGRAGASDGTAASDAYAGNYLLTNLQVNGKKISYEFSDCRFSSLNVSGGYHAGGYIGCLKSDEGNKDDSTIFANIVASSSDTPLGKDSTIQTTDELNQPGAMGGLFGHMGDPLRIGGSDSSTIKLVDVNLNSTTSCAGAGGFVGNYSSGNRGGLQIENSSFEASEGNTSTIGSTQNAKSNKHAAGAVGTIASGKASHLTNCTVKNVKLVSREGDGGFVGSIGSGEVVADGIAAENVQIDGSCSGGFLGVTDGNALPKVTLKNSQFKGVTLGDQKALWDSSLGNVSGTIAGDARGTFALSNILIKDCVYKDSAHQGLLTGNADSNNLKKFYVAGLEVRQSTGYPTELFYAGSGDPKEVHKKAFVSFSNYGSDASISDKALYGDAAQVEPYATTTPVSSLAVKETSDADSRYLYGDGANLDVAKTIVSNAADSASSRFLYKNIGGMSSGGEYSSDSSFKDSWISTYGSNDNTLPTGVEDFNVLQISGGDTGAIESYLNVITNGGFSEAVAQNGSMGSSDPVVSATAFVYKSDGSEFVKQGEDGTVTVEGNGTSSMNFKVHSGYDNGENRFTLIAVTFKAADGLTHTVMVPVIVRRQLETTFTATLTHGTPFHGDAYTNKGQDARLLESYGSSATALLTYTYNKALSEPAEYGWDSYLAAGGNMGPVNKTITFDNNNTAQLPAGTQFTLIDKDNGDHTYTYTLPSEGQSFTLSDFTDTEDPNVKYSPKWMSELMGVTATKTEDKSGAWVTVDDANVATAKDVSGNYYRPAQDGETGDRYTLECGKSDGKEMTPSESFYLVIYLPKSDDSQPAINGSIKSVVSCDGVKVGETHYALRTDGSADSQNNTASTYSFYSGYVQALSDVSRDANQTKVPDDQEAGAGHLLHMDVEDKISFDNSQVYTAKDSLYYRLDTSLTSFNNGNPTSSGGLPAGTSGTAHFYVYTKDAAGNKMYYQANGAGTAGITWTSVNSEVEAASVEWASNGSNMELNLGKDLAGVRGQSGGTFYVEVKMDIHLSEEAFKAVIAPSQRGDGTDAYTLLNYRGLLADDEGDLASSSTVQTAQGLAKYYRKDTGVSLISLTANQTRQLGINLNDLNSMGNGDIGATGIYDMTALTNADEVLAKATKVVYSMTLERRSGTDGSYTSVNGEIGSFFTVSSDELGQASGGNGSVYSWTDVAGDGGFATKDPQTNKFKLSLRIKVNTTLDAHEYSNYRIRLSAKLYDSNGYELDNPWNKNQVYGSGSDAHSDYITYTLTRVKLDGLDASASGN